MNKIKHILLIIHIVALLPVFVQAQVPVGGWTLHSSFTGVDDMEETGSYLYYRSGGSLFRVDKETMEVGTLSLANLLNDTDVTGIYPDADHKSILVTYTSGNMDRLYDNGTIVNIPDIRDSSVSGSHKINDIAFGKDQFYVATEFGLVTYNNRKNEVTVSALTPNRIEHVVTMGDIVGIHYDRQMRFAPQSEKIISLDKIPLIGSYTRSVGWLDMEGFGDDGVLLLNRENINGKVSNKLYTLKVDLANQTVQQTGADAATSRDAAIGFESKVRSLPGGRAYSSNEDGIFVYGPADREVIKLPRTDASSVNLSYTGNMSEIWLGDGDGVRLMDYADSGSGSLVHDNIKGSDMTVPQIHVLHVGSAGQIIIGNRAEHLSFGVSLSGDKQSKVNVLKDGVFTDLSGIDVELQNKNSGSFSQPGPHFVNWHFSMCDDPSEENAYYIGSFMEGLYRIKDGKQTHKYYTDNAPFPTIGANAYACTALQPLVDRNGNLWVYLASEQNENANRIFVLPSSKRLSDNQSISDWKGYPINEQTKDDRDALGLVCKHSDCIIFAMGRYSQKLVVFDTKGTPELSDDTKTVITSYTDQDGKILDFSHILSICEDARGRIWIGTDDGVFEISDITKAVSRNIAVNHLKVPRNDGTNFADYLLANQMVSSISCDNANRKWISTIGSGVYLVNENGDEIIENHTSDNSILPNTVYAVACDPNSNKVYFGTAIGLVEYSSTSAPGSENYDNVYAYPNPVRPDYTGWITVTGLMENSLVKIADADGNVFHQGRSDGGMFTWDGCNSAGERVKTGVYFVFASQNANGGSSACVTKIMVIN